MRLTRQHFTLYRGYLDGVSVEQLHRSYGEADIGRDEPERHAHVDVRTLEAQRDQVGPDSVYGEAELLELYRVDRKIARNARLRARQAAALTRMESPLAEAPSPAHPLDGWLEPVAAARLAVAGLTTRADLLALIRRRRQRW